MGVRVNLAGGAAASDRMIIELNERRMESRK
jgi:hypothetical protein